MEKAPEICILCKTKDRKLLIEKDSWTVYRCPDCGLGFLDPRPAESEIRQFYQSDYFSKRYDSGFEPGSSQYKKRIRGEDHRIRFIKKIKVSGCLLDIGCGYGYFLAACREEGYEVKGIDVSEWAVEYAAQKLGISVVNGQIENVSFPSNAFDIICMWHSLEHTPDPHLTLQKAKLWLKNDGILVVDVPNYEETDAQERWENWDDWSLPYHLWHFTFKSLTKLFDMHGFRVIKSKNYHSNVVKERLRRIPVIGLFARPIAKMYSGSSVAVIAKRKI